MAATNFHGKQGLIKWDTAETDQVTGWSVDISCDVTVVSEMQAVAVTATTHWKDYEVGFKDWTATVEAIVESTGLDPDFDTDLKNNATATLELHELREAAVDILGYWSGSALLTDMSFTVDKNEVARVTYTFQGSGTLSYTT